MEQSNVTLPQYSHQTQNFAYQHEVRNPQTSYVQPLIVDETKQYSKEYGDSIVEELSDDEEKNIIAQHNELFVGSAKTQQKKTRGRVKIKMEFIQNKLRRYTTFSKRKTGIMKKAYELSTLTGTQVMLLVASETGHVYTFATRKLQPMITSESGKALIQTCLNSPDPAPTVTVQVQQSPICSEPSLPTQVQIQSSDHRISHSNFPEPSMHYTSEPLNKVSSTDSIEYVAQSVDETAAYMTNTSVETTKHMIQPSANYTTIITPASVAGNQTTPAVQLAQPQILSGQLQVHRIHPQNIILTANSPILRTNNVILNQGSIVESSSSTVQDQVVSTSQVLTLVNQAQPNNTPVQWVYNPGSGVIYAPSNSVSKRGDSSNNETVSSLQHTPVIQTSAFHPEKNAVISRHVLDDGTILVRK